MSCNTPSGPVKVAFRSDTPENWRAANPVLLAGEPAYELGTGKVKIGDGRTNYNDLRYQLEQGPQGQTGPAGAAASAGPAGPKGDQGPAGPTGATGSAGGFASVVITTTSATTPSATITGTAPNQVLNLSIPKGDKGDAGSAASLAIGTVSSGAAPLATITGTAPNQVLNLTLQQGPQGPQGIQGIQGIQGVKGDTGATGATGPQGTAAGITIKGVASAWPPSSSPTAFDAWILPATLPTGTPYGYAPRDIAWYSGTAWFSLGTVQGPKGDTGATGATGATGSQGVPGATGPANSLAVTATSGTAAAATITGTAPNQTLNLVLPTGQQGPQGIQGPAGQTGATGPACDLTVGTVTQLAPGVAPTASTAGTAPNKTLNLGLPSCAPCTIQKGNVTTGATADFNVRTVNGISYLDIQLPFATAANSTSFTTNPTTQTVSSGASFTLRVVAVSTEATLVYSWQYSDDSGANWVTIAGAGTNSLTSSLTVSQTGRRYRAVATTPLLGPTYSAVATISVSNATVSSLYNWTIYDPTRGAAKNCLAVNYTSGLFVRFPIDSATALSSADGKVWASSPLAGYSLPITNDTKQNAVASSIPPGPIALVSTSRSGPNTTGSLGTGGMYLIARYQGAGAASVRTFFSTDGAAWPSGQAYGFPSDNTASPLPDPFLSAANDSSIYAIGTRMTQFKGWNDTAAFYVQDGAPTQAPGTASYSPARAGTSLLSRFSPTAMIAGPSGATNAINVLGLSYPEGGTTSGVGVRSTDNGGTWNWVSLPAECQSFKFNAICAGKAGAAMTLVAVGNGPRAMRSTDNGATWSSVLLPSSGNWTAVGFSGGAWGSQTGGAFVAVCEYSQTGAYSIDDGLTWSPFQMPGVDDWNNIAFCDNKGVVTSTTRTYQCQFGVSNRVPTVVAPVVHATSFTQNPASQTVADGTLLSLSALASSTEATINYSWQYSDNAGSTWTTIPGATLTSYSVTVAVANNGRQYRCVATTPVLGATPSSVATITVAVTSNVPTLFDFKIADPDGGAANNQCLSADYRMGHWYIANTQTIESQPTVAWASAGGDRWYKSRIPGRVLGTTEVGATIPNGPTGICYTGRRRSTDESSPFKTLGATFLVGKYATWTGPAQQYAYSLLGKNTDGSITSKEYAAAPSPETKLVFSSDTAFYTASKMVPVAQGGTGRARVFAAYFSGTDLSTGAVTASSAGLGDGYTELEPLPSGFSPTCAITKPVDRTDGSIRYDTIVMFGLSYPENGPKVAACVRSTTGGVGANAWQWVTVPNEGAAIEYLSMGGGSITSGQRTIVAVGNGLYALRSTDYGASWTARQLPGAGKWQSVAFTGGKWGYASTASPELSKFLAVCESSMTGACSSDGGLTWQSFLLPANDTWNNVVCMGSYAVLTSLTKTYSGFLKDSGFTGITDPINSTTFVTQPQSQSIVNGGGITLQAVATSTETPIVYSWQYSDDAGATWTTISGATSTTYSSTLSTAQNGRRFRAAATTTVLGAVYSSTAIITVTGTAIASLYSLTCVDQTRGAAKNCLIANYSAGSSYRFARAIPQSASILTSGNGTDWTATTALPGRGVTATVANASAVPVGPISLAVRSWQSTGGVGLGGGAGAYLAGRYSSLNGTKVASEFYFSSDGATYSGPLAGGQVDPVLAFGNHSRYYVVSTRNGSLLGSNQSATVSVATDNPTSSTSGGVTTLNGNFTAVTSLASGFSPTCGIAGAVDSIGGTSPEWDLSNWYWIFGVMNPENGGTPSSRVIYSNEGGTRWSTGTLPADCSTMKVNAISAGTSVANGSAPILVAVGDGQRALRSINNGVTWTSVPLPASAANSKWTAVGFSGGPWGIFTGGVWVALQDGSSNLISTGAYSTDNGATWTAFLLPGADDYTGIAFASNTVVITSSTRTWKGTFT